jgi:hypothetical protein
MVQAEQAEALNSWASFPAWLHHGLRWRQLSFSEQLAHLERESYILEPGIDALGVERLEWVASQERLSYSI